MMIAVGSVYQKSLYILPRFPLRTSAQTMFFIRFLIKSLCIFLYHRLTFFLSYAKDNIKSYVRTCVHGLPQKKSSIG